ESALAAPIHVRSKQCLVYHRSGESLIVALEDQEKVYIFALKGGSVGTGSGIVSSGSKTLAVTVVGDALGLGFHRGTPLDLEDIWAGTLPAGLEALTAEGRANPQNPYNDPGTGSGGCKASCSATRQNPLKILGTDTCSVDCTPPNCASCSQD